MPSEYFVAVSIVCEDSEWQTYFQLPYIHVLQRGSLINRKLKDTEALWIFHDGSVKYTPGFEELIIKRY